MKKVVVNRSQLKRMENSDDHFEWRLAEKSGCYYHGRGGRWVAACNLGFIPEGFRGSLSLEKQEFPPWMFFDDGWNGSFHDCHYHEDIMMLVVVGRSPQRARKRLRKAVELVKGMKPADTAQLRFEARRQVREGD